MPVQAIKYGIDEFGAADKIQAKTCVLPELNDTQVLIKVHSSAINPIDLKTRAGLGFVAQAKEADEFLPLGYDLYGVVEQCGVQVSDLQVGQFVAGMVGFAKQPGCYADYVIAEADELIAFDVQQKSEVAGLCLAGLTAIQALKKFSSSQSTLYINAPTGGVGHLAIQLAQLQGKEVVAVSNRPSHQLLQKLAVKVVDYETFFSQKRQAQLLDLVGGEIGERMVANLNSGSEVVTVPTISAQQIVAAAQQSDITVSGIVVEKNKADLNELVTAYRGGDLFIHVDSTFALQDIQQAHEYMEAGQHAGKIIISHS
ncbi:NADP-dependent oxidoreductase [Pseudoalteromonas phenolica]|uniref:NADP-dependent oxidoreductase n=1 Tax=Pseudoalteromonas phenolica TaxID=161398 RepID=UPI00384B934D